jgi:flagellar motility protein MotE (MotC chaperone)
MKSLTRYFRLLPAVFVVGTGLLALKGVDIARAAQAPAQASDEPDNSGLAPTDIGGGTPPRDFASDDSVAGSAGEVDVLSSLTRRRAELDARERALAMRENLLNAGEGRVDQKIGALKNLQTQMQGLLAQRDAAQTAQIASLIKSYSGMKPASSAVIFNTMPDEVLLPIAKGMKPDDLGAIMSKMNPDAAQKLTVKLAALLKLPEATPAICPATPGVQADLTTPAAGTAPPVQTAALSPPGSLPVVTPLPPAPPPVQAAPAQTTPPAPAPVAATPLAPPPTQASTPPKPHAPPVHHPAVTHPAATPPVKPAMASATPPAKPAAVPAATPPAKPTTAATPVVTLPAPTPTTTPAKPATQAASGPPMAIAPAPAPGG